MLAKAERGPDGEGKMTCGILPAWVNQAKWGKANQREKPDG
jgi:hypothetical protein